MQMIRVLVVDDNAGFRRRIGEFLAAELGIEVVGEAANNEEALQKARELDPDIVLMDVRMPGVNGISTTRQLKEQMPDVKVIILSRFDVQEYKEAAAASGASGYVLKKSLLKVLVPTIRATMLRLEIDRSDAGVG